jgi:hypothetical protein
MNCTFSNTNKLTPNDMKQSGHTDSLYNSKLFLMDDILLRYYSCIYCYYYYRFCYSSYNSHSYYILRLKATVSFIKYVSPSTCIRATPSRKMFVKFVILHFYYTCRILPTLLQSDTNVKLTQRPTSLYIYNLSPWLVLTTEINWVLCELSGEAKDKKIYSWKCDPRKVRTEAEERVRQTTCSIA